MQNPHAHTTHSNLRLRDANDAHVLFQAVRQGHFQLIRRRLNGPEQQRLAPGHVYVWADREGALERWTDGHNWSPSRVRGAFLMYDEMPEPPEASFLRRKKPTGHPGEKVKHPRKKRLPPLPGGLSKQTYSATLMEGGLPVQKWHLTAYFTDAAVPNLQTVEDDPILRQTVVPPNTFIGSMSGRRKSKSSKQPNQRENSESNLESADNSLVNSPVQEYANHASYPLEADSSRQWNATPEPRDNTYDDSGSGSTGSAGTIRDEASSTRRDSFGGVPVSPIFDQPPPPLSTPSGPPPETISHWSAPLVERLKAPDERRGSLASVDSSQSHTSTSTASSGGISTSASSRLYASSASSMSPVPNSHSPSSPWAPPYTSMSTSSFSSLAPWAGPGSSSSSKSQQGYNLNSPFPLDNTTSTGNFQSNPPQLTQSQQSPLFTSSSSGAQPIAVPTPRQSNFAAAFSEFSPSSDPDSKVSLSQPGLTFPQGQHPQLEISLSLHNENAGFGSSTPMSAPPIGPGPDNLPFSSHPSTAAFHHQQHQQNLRQRASTLSAVSSPLHQASHGSSSSGAAAAWTPTGLYGWSPMATDDQPMHSPSHTTMSQQPFTFTASSDGNHTDGSTLGTDVGITLDHSRAMNIPPPHRPSPTEVFRRASYQGSAPHSQATHSPSSIVTGEQYIGRASDVFESALQPSGFPFHQHPSAGMTTGGMVAVGSSSLEQSQAILHGRVYNLSASQRHPQQGHGLWGGGT